MKKFDKFYDEYGEPTRHCLQYWRQLSMTIAEEELSMGIESENNVASNDHTMIGFPFLAGERLLSCGIRTLGDLIVLSENDLRSLKFGRSFILSIMERLVAHRPSYCLRPDAIRIRELPQRLKRFRKKRVLRCPPHVRMHFILFGARLTPNEIALVSNVGHSALRKLIAGYKVSPEEAIGPRFFKHAKRGEARRRRNEDRGPRAVARREHEFEKVATLLETRGAMTVKSAAEKLKLPTFVITRHFELGVKRGVFVRAFPGSHYYYSLKTKEGAKRKKVQLGIEALLEACLSDRRPDWMQTVRPSFYEEDADVVVESDVGKLFVKIKGSIRGGHQSPIGVVVVNKVDDEERLLAKVVDVLGPIRQSRLDKRKSA